MNEEEDEGRQQILIEMAQIAERSTEKLNQELERTQQRVAESSELAEKMGREHQSVVESAQRLDSKPSSRTGEARNEPFSLRQGELIVHQTQQGHLC